MGIIISLYSRSAFKEFILPLEKNADHEVTLRANYFNIQDDVKLKFEVLDGIWSLRKTRQYRIIKDNRQQDSVEIVNQDALSIHTVHQDEIYLFVRYVDAVVHAYQKHSLNGTNRITIGKNSSNDICYDYRSMVSREHAIIVKTESGYKIENKSSNGVYVDSILIEKEKELVFGAHINILGLHMVYLGDMLAIDMYDSSVVLNENVISPILEQSQATVYMANSIEKNIIDKTIYHRAPRNYEKLDSDIIEIESPPELEQEKKKSLLMSVGPSLTMALPMLLGCLLMVYANNKSGVSSSLYMYSGLVMSVSSASMAVIWTIINQKQDRKDREAKKIHRFETYSKYLVEKADEIKEYYEDTTRRLLETYPNVESCLKYDEKKGMLWNRNFSHDDFLAHRLGIGDKAFQYDIDVPKKRFTLYKDELFEKPSQIKENYNKLIDVPITVDLLEKRLIGLVGGTDKSGAITIKKILASQIAANNCYVDVKMAFIYDNDSSSDNGQWDYVKWLPHVWSEDKRVRYVAANREDASEVFYELTKVFRTREEQKSEMDKNTVARPHYVVFISDSKMLEGEAFSKYVKSNNKELGLTTVILTDRREWLPNECEFHIENSDKFKGAYNIFEGRRNRQIIKFDQVNDEDLDIFARHLSSLHVSEVEQGGEIPNDITFFEMYGINRIQEYPVKEMWAKCRTYESIRGLLGQRAGGAPCFLDVHEKYHGPHGLVAGTTGSGKSETLQTYILSLAINYSPDDVCFFIIDYKGGGMANQFDGLPHMIGSISNLSGNQVKRAMISINSENKRRQRLFEEHGVNNVNNYTKLYKNGEAVTPIPHLFIIIDEFAELKREEPEFMKELISVAQVGRSLGVHMILATQKPSGTVDDNIWSNSKFRLCLRVQDQQDSKDMLHKPDAAYITQAGRGYLQVGNDEIYELFQSGYSGAVFDENMAASEGDIAKLITINGKVDITGNSVKQSQKKKSQLIWIENLIKIISHALIEAHSEIEAATDLDAKQEIIANCIYAYFSVNGIDYEDNSFNRKRLKDFMNLYGSVTKHENSPASAEQIVRLANKLGIKLPQEKEKTQLDATKDYLNHVAKNNGYHHKLSLWMPVLREKIYVEEFKKTAYCNGVWNLSTEEKELKIVIGQVDDPENQSQMPIMFDFIRQGHVVIIGSVVSGKSTLMQTMMYGLITSYSPDYVNIYALDYSSRMLSAFENAPHVGGIIYENDDKKIARFFNMITKEVGERKELFRGGNYKQYIQKNGVKAPAIIIFIDEYASFKEKTNQKYEDQMIQLSKEGVSLGIYLVISGAGFGYADISTRVGENLETAFCLALPEKYAYGEVLHNMGIDVMPESGIKGRGLAYYESRILEYQVALAVEAENDYMRMEAIQNVCVDMNSKWSGNIARSIPEIPEKPTWSKFIKLGEYKKSIGNKDMLAVAYDEADAEVFGIPLKDIYCYLITGASKSGKTNYMKVMVKSALDKKSHVAIFDGPKQDMKAFSKFDEIKYLDDEEKVFEYFSQELTPVFQERNRTKNALLAEGKDELDVYKEMSEKQPYFIFISDMCWFVNMIYKSSAKNMAGFMETLITKGRYHNIYFVAEISYKKYNEVRGYQMFESFSEYHTGVHFGGKTNENTLMSFEYMSFAEQSSSESPGIGRIPGTSTYRGTKKIVVPLAGK